MDTIIFTQEALLDRIGPDRYYHYACSTSYTGTNDRAKAFFFATAEVAALLVHQGKMARIFHDELNDLDLSMSDRVIIWQYSDHLCEKYLPPHSFEQNPMVQYFVHLVKTFMPKRSS